MEPFRIKANTRKLGAWLPVTPTTHPDNFRNLGRVAETEAEAREKLRRRLQLTIDDGNVRPDDEIDITDDDIEDESDDTPAPPPANMAQAMAEALGSNDPPWKRNQPKAQPLTYAIPTDDRGKVKYKSLGYRVDFSNAKSVEKANKARRQDIYRAANDFDLPLKRPSTSGREHTQANNDWIAQRHDTFAAANGNKCISIAQLHTDYLR